MAFKDYRLAIGVCVATLCASFLAAGCESRQVTVVIKTVAADKAADAGGGDAPGAQTGGWGNLTGTVTLTGDFAELPPLFAKGAAPKDPSVCGVEAIPNESVIVNPANKGLANVVLFLEKPALIKPELKKAADDTVTFDQKGCHFLPHVLLVRIGQTVLVKSGDSVVHNTRTSPVRNTPFNSTVKPEDRVGVPLKYTKPEAIPVPVACDLHPWMQALHFPVDHPYVALTDKDGKFKIEGLPTGKHQFKVWHEKAKFLDRKLEVTIEADKDASVELKYAPAQFN